MGLRRSSRELAVQALYSIEFIAKPPEAALGEVSAGTEYPSDVMEFAMRLLRGVLDHREELDGMIAKYVAHWRPDRIAPVDRNILRLAIFELLHCPDIPRAVAINEAVDLAKQFGDAKSGNFVNGIVDAVNKELAADSTSPK